MQYLGIAADEPLRIEKHAKRKDIILPLAEIGWDEDYCGFRLIYDNVSEQVDGLDGLMAVDAADIVKGANNIE